MVCEICYINNHKSFHLLQNINEFSILPQNPVSKVEKRRKENVNNNHDHKSLRKPNFSGSWIQEFKMTFHFPCMCNVMGCRSICLHWTTRLTYFVSFFNN